jgi:hypothetical protein
VLGAAIGGFVFFRNKNKPADTPYSGTSGIPPAPFPAHDAPTKSYTNSSAHNTYAPLRPSYPPQKQSYASPVPAQPTIVNNYGGSGGSDMLTGVLVGNMIANSGNHHDHTTYVERDTTPTYEAPKRSSSWEDDTPAPAAKSSSWDDTPAKSSSWDDTSSSSSSSSWSSSSDNSSSWSSSDSSSSSSDSGSSSD